MRRLHCGSLYKGSMQAQQKDTSKETLGRESLFYWAFCMGALTVLGGKRESCYRWTIRCLPVR